MLLCPFCGSTKPGAGAPGCPDCGTRLDAEDQIASWLDAPPEAPGRRPVSPVPVCTACGYEGDMIVEGDRGGTTCPACFVVIQPRRTEAATRVVRVIECPECGRSIGLAREDAARTVICPGCSCFLGTFGVGAAR